MRTATFFFAVTSTALFFGCKKTSTTDTTQPQDMVVSETKSERSGNGGKYGLRSVYRQFEEDEPLMICVADGPIYRKTNFKSNANRDYSPMKYAFWDATINYNSDKTVFISNKLMAGANNVGIGLLGNDIPIGDTIVFASVYNGRIDYSRAGKLNGYYDKMQYYYDGMGRLMRIVNWTNTRFGGNRIFDFRFRYDRFDNLLSWEDVSINKVGKVTYTYDYRKPVKNAYYNEMRNFIDPPFTIMQQFGLLPAFNCRHLRQSAHVQSMYYPQEMWFTYTSQVVNAGGNLVEYYCPEEQQKYFLTWSAR